MVEDNESSAEKNNTEADAAQSDINNTNANSEDVIGEDDMEQLLKSVSDNSHAIETSTAEGNDDDNQELSDEELDRLANMNLDELLGEASDGKFAEKDLPYQGDEENKPEEKKLDSAESSSTGIESLFGTAAKPQETEALPKTEPQTDRRTAEKQQPENNSQPVNNGTADISKKDKKNTKKKETSKKGLLSIIKNIFFESLEDEVKADEAAKAHAQNEAESIASELNDNLSNENERVIKEVYEEKNKNTDMAEPKGFFAKMKYRMAQIK